jgi:hypothetical protein
MKSTKIFQVIKQFNPYEINRLRKYVYSPYFNVNDRLSELFSLIEKSIREGSDDTLDKDEIWSHIGEEGPYNDVRFRKHCSDLLRLVEGWLAQEQYQENPLHQANYLMEAVYHKRLESLYNSVLTTARRLSDRQLLRPASFYFYQFQLERNFYDLSESRIKRESKANLEEIINNLDYFYLAEKLRYYCSTFSRKKFGQFDYEFLFIDEIIQVIERENFDHIPPISIYYHVYKSYVERDNDENYFQLKKLIFEFIDLFPNDEAKDILDAAINYAISNLNKGSEAFLRECFELYKYSIQKEIIFIDNELSPWSMKNIVVNGLRLDEFDWVESFITEYINRVNPKYRKNAYYFNLAILNIYKKNFEEVLPLLQHVDLNDFSYYLDTKMTLITTYYELDEYESMEFTCDSLLTYLKRDKKMPADRKQRYKRYVYYMKKLARQIATDKGAIKKLKEELLAESGVIRKEWIRDKLDELAGIPKVN